MKKRILALIGLSLACGLAAPVQAMPREEPQAAAQTGAPSPAQSAPPAAVHTPAGPTRVGIIQAQAALLGTKDGQRAFNELNKKLDPTKAALEKKAVTIRELTDKLQRGGNAMADAAKAELNRNIADLTKAYNRDMEDAQAEADAENRKMFDELTGKITKVIDNYAVANGYTLILNVSDQNTPVLYAANNTDITAEVIALYDKTYPVTLAPATTSAPKPAPTTTPAKPAATPVTPKKQP